MLRFPGSCLLFALLCAAAPSRAQSLPADVLVETLAPGLDAPVAFDFLPDGRVLFAEQNTGFVRVFRTDTGVQVTNVISLPDVVAGGERGLLGLAVDPSYPQRPYLYLFYSVTGHTRIARFTLTGDLGGGPGGTLTADLTSRHDLLDAIPDQAPNHNGGTLRFGLDGMLYASLGEDAVPCAAQDSSSERGEILRMDVRQLPPGPGRAFVAQLAAAGNPFASAPDSSARLVFARGLRNPFRFQSDPVNGTLVIGDVGENLREELDLLQVPVPIPLGPADATPAPAGANFGWPYLEGTALGAHRFDCGPAPPNLVAPAFEYDRTQQSFGAAIISAGAYWSTPGLPARLPAHYSGNLFFNDYYTGALVRLERVGNAYVVAAPEPGQPSAAHWGEGFQTVSDWRIGPDGAFWFCRQYVNGAAFTGSLGRIVPAVPPPPPPSPPLEIRVLDSPSVGTARFLFPNGVPKPARLTLHALDGRVVRTWGDAQVGGILAGRFLEWDGRDDDSRKVPPGFYVLRLESAGREVSARVTFLR